MHYQAVLTDIEGTTTSISFVYDTLFPYARKQIDTFCEKAQKMAEIREVIDLLQREYSQEQQGSLPDFGNGAPYLRYLMDIDRKSTGLKKLQGIIWRDGYLNGDLKGHIFPDVVEILKEWQSKKIRIRIFSSGSVLAQKLLFGYSDYGDLTSYFEGYHDTTTGPKKEADSYKKIADQFALPAKEILFLSDVLAELDAARIAGYQTGLLVRPGNKEVEKHSHTVYENFLGLVRD